jgi:hypothetical protein
MAGAGNSLGVDYISMNEQINDRRKESEVQNFWLCALPIVKALGLRLGRQEIITLWNRKVTYESSEHLEGGNPRKKKVQTLKGSSSRAVKVNMVMAWELCLVIMTAICRFHQNRALKHTSTTTVYSYDSPRFTKAARIVHCTKGGAG